MLLSPLVAQGKAERTTVRPYARQGCSSDTRTTLPGLSHRGQDLARFLRATHGPCKPRHRVPYTCRGYMIALAETIACWHIVAQLFGFVNTYKENWRGLLQSAALCSNMSYPNFAGRGFVGVWGFSPQRMKHPYVYRMFQRRNVTGGWRHSPDRSSALMLRTGYSGQRNVKAETTFDVINIIIW